MSRALSGKPAPELTVTLTDGSSWSLAKQQPTHFVMLAIYRHSQCGVCNAYLKQLNALAHDFATAGVNIMAASVDDEATTKQMIADLDLHNLSLGCRMPLDMASEWGLFVSARRKVSEPEFFLEPALFLIDNGGALYYSAIQSMPFGRPSLPEILQWIPKVIQNGIQARGEVETY